MELKQLETYLCVCKRKSFSKAARELYISQPTVSTHILSLEEELNVLLINRTSRNFQLTHAGELLFDFANRVVIERSKLVNTFLQFSNIFTGLIDIISSTIPAVEVVPNFIGQFSALYPDVTFKVHHFDSIQVIEELENKNCAFGFTGCKKKNSTLRFYSIAEDEMALIEGKNAGFIQSKCSAINIDDLADKPFIVREKGSGSKYFIDNILSESNSLKLNVVAEVETSQLIKKLVMLNMGLSFISKNILTEDDLKKVNVYTLKNIELNRKLYFVYNPNQYFTPIEDKFKNMILQQNKDARKV